MFHKHKYGEIKGRYQYCTVCGKAEPVECNHQWKTISTFEKGTILSSNIYAYVYVQQCKCCGLLQQVEAK